MSEDHDDEQIPVLCHSCSTKTAQRSRGDLCPNCGRGRLNAAPDEPEPDLPPLGNRRLEREKTDEESDEEQTIETEQSDDWFSAKSE